MASNTTFFTPADPISINTLLTLEGALQWIVQTVTPSETADRASGLGADGDEAAHESHNTVERLTATYKCFGTTGSLSLPTVGAVAATYHIDNVQLAYDPVGWPTLTVAMHKHADSATHTEDSCNEYAAGIAFPAQFGIPSTLGTDFASGSALVAMRSLSYALSCTHVDELGATGDWHAGDNHDGVETLDAEFTGDPDDADLTIASTWHTSTDETGTGNTTVNSRKLSLTRHIAREA